MKKYIYLDGLSNRVMLLNKVVYFFLSLDNRYVLLNVDGLYLYLSYGYAFTIRSSSMKYFNLKYFFFCWTNYIVKKVKFKHKTSWVLIYRKNLNLMRLSLGFSHRFFFFLFFRVKRKKKYLSRHTLTIWGINYLMLVNWISSFVRWLLYNHYTRRGFRPARYSFLKRIGKVSHYMAFKSKIF